MSYQSHRKAESDETEDECFRKTFGSACAHPDHPTRYEDGQPGTAKSDARTNTLPQTAPSHLTTRRLRRGPGGDRTRAEVRGRRLQPLVRRRRAVVVLYGHRPFDFRVTGFFFRSCSHRRSRYGQNEGSSRSIGVSVRGKNTRPPCAANVFSVFRIRSRARQRAWN